MLDKGKELNRKILDKIFKAYNLGCDQKMAIWVADPDMVVDVTTASVYLHEKDWDTLRYYHANHEEPGFPEEYRELDIKSIASFTILDIRQFKGLYIDCRARG